MMRRRGQWIDVSGPFNLLFGLRSTPSSPAARRQSIDLAVAAGAGTRGSLGGVGRSEKIRRCMEIPAK
jgi:hypothetical protein